MSTAAATISVPYDLGIGARHLRTAAGRIYFRHFLSTLVPKLAHLQATFPDVRDRVLQGFVSSRSLEDRPCLRDQYSVA